MVYVVMVNVKRASIPHIYRDTGHLSITGSALIGKKMRFYDLIVDNNSTLVNSRDYK